jgi:competence protein ComFC
VHPILAELLAPARCVLCRAPAALACAACLASLPLICGPTCARCGRPAGEPVRDCVECRGRRLGFASARAPLAYDGAGRALVHALKDGGARALADLAAALLAMAVPAPAADALTWVPGDPWRTVRRGYHPPALIAERLAARWGLPALPLLRATRLRRSQRGLDPAARRANVRGAFRCPPRARVAPVVVLVDDVYTTGATLSACASALRRGGARRVEGLALARAVRG